jgi:pSer/pThr/pTyr-binding forkhead associated (FHA) protein
MAKDAGGCVMRVVKGPDEGAEFEVTGNGPYAIGRSEDVALRVTDPTVSHEHAQLENVNGIWFLTDAGSRHGTFVNKRKITGRKALFDRDVVRVGKSLLEFREYEKPEREEIREVRAGLRRKRRSDA